VRGAGGSARILNFQPRNIKRAEEDIRMQIKSQLPKLWEPLKREVFIERLVYVFPPVRSLTKTQIAMMKQGLDVYKLTKPDLTDNLNKLLFDALQGLVYKNDSQVVLMKEVKKIYGEIPRTELVISS